MTSRGLKIGAGALIALSVVALATSVAYKEKLDGIHKAAFPAVATGFGILSVASIGLLVFFNKKLPTKTRISPSSNIYIEKDVPRVQVEELERFD